MKNKELKKVIFIKENDAPKSIFSFNSDFFLTDVEKSKIVGGQDELEHCRKGYYNDGSGFIRCKCSYTF
jgi:hypothetical protein